MDPKLLLTLLSREDRLVESAKLIAQAQIVIHLCSKNKVTGRERIVPLQDALLLIGQ